MKEGNTFSVFFFIEQHARYYLQKRCFRSNHESGDAPRPSALTDKFSGAKKWEKERGI